MGWFRKIVNVLIVVGVAALMSIPFKRVPPQATSKSGERGHWELDRPGLPFKLGEIITGDERPTTSNKPVIPAPQADRVGEAGGERVVDDREPPSTLESSSTESSSTSGERFENDSPSLPNVPAIRDDERRRPMSTMPRIEGQPPRAERLDESSSLPDLPSEYQPLGEP